MKPIDQIPGAGYVLTLGDTSCDVLLKAPSSGKKSSAGPELIAGGTAGNTAKALARLGLHSKLVTELGSDFYGGLVHERLRKNNVDTEFVFVFDRLPTTQVIILLDENDSPAADWPIADPRLFEMVTPEDISEAMVANASWVHTSGTSVMYANSRRVMLHTINLARQTGVPLSFDINLRLHGEVESAAGIEAVLYAVRHADVVFGSRAEWMHLASADNAEQAARSLLSTETQVAVIRDGPAGSVGVVGAQREHAPAYRVKVRDALGAGDTFDAGFILAQLEQNSLAERLRWGNAVAALKLMQLGGQRAGPTRKQLKDFLDASPELIG